jgi:serine protease Do
MLAVAVSVVGCQKNLAQQASAGGGAAPATAAATPAPAQGGGAGGAANGPVTPKTEMPNEARVLSSAFAAVAKALRPSVVRVDVEVQRVAQRGRPQAPESEDDASPFFRRFFQFGPGGDGAEPPPSHGTGSGVVMDTNGNIVTNGHVVSGATSVKVTFSDGREFTAKTIGADPETDIAVIRLENPPKDLTAARLGDSGKLEVGEWVLAVGSPLGLDQTVTAGIISGKGRVGKNVVMSGGRVREYVQTDAKINPGNSGGPLVNLSSEVVGINTLINTGPGGAYGFAIPINQVRGVTHDLLKEGRVRYPYLGVMVGDLRDLDPQRRSKLGLDSTQKGALCSDVTPGGPAAKAGLRPGDIITDLNGNKVESARDVIDTVSTLTIGVRVEVGLLRDGKRVVIPVTLGELPSEAAGTGAQPEALGLALQTLTPSLAESMGIDPATHGAVVAEVQPGSPAAKVGLAPGDVILEVDRKAVTSREDAAAALKAPRKGGHLLRVRNASGTRFVTIGSE